MGYLILAEKQYKNKINLKNHSWNFGPNKSNFKKVIDIIRYIKKLKKFEYSLKKNNKFKETNILKLNSSKAKNKLKWVSKLSLNQSLKETVEWNTLVNKGVPAKNICEKQFLMHVNLKKDRYK